MIKTRITDMLGIRVDQVGLPELGAAVARVTDAEVQQEQALQAEALSRCSMGYGRQGGGESCS